MAGVEAHGKDWCSVGLNAVQGLIAASPGIIDVYSGRILVCYCQLCLRLPFLHAQMHTHQSS